MIQTCCVMPSDGNRCMKCLCLVVLTVLKVFFSSVLAENKGMVHVFGLSLCLIRKWVLTCLASLSVWGVIRSLDCCQLWDTLDLSLSIDYVDRHISCWSAHIPQTWSIDLLIAAETCLWNQTICLGFLSFDKIAVKKVNFFSRKFI